MIPIYNDMGEVAKDSYGRVIYTETPADTLLKDYKEPHITIGGSDIPVWLYIEMYCPIEDRDSNLSGFALNHSQIEEYKAMAEQYVAEGRIRLNIGKSRQMGGTTLISAFLWTLALKPGTKVGIIADTEAKGIGILNKYKVFYANCPEPIGSMLRKCEVANNSKELSFDFGKGRKTSFVVLTQGDGAGVSFHFNLIHESEVAVWENISITISKLEKTVSNADPRSVIVRETTARGHNDWEKLYLRGKYRKGTFRSIFVPWYWEPSYKSRYDGHNLNEYELKLRDEYGLSLDQIQFWYESWQDVDCDYNELAAEYPTNDVEMFSSTSTPAFSGELVDRQRKAVEACPYLYRGRFVFGTKSDGLRGKVEILDPRWVEDHNGPIKVFEEVPPSHPMFVCTDPANGGSDYWASEVFDNSDFRQIAVFHQQGSKVDADTASLQSLVLLAAMQCGCFHDGKFDPTRFDIAKAHQLRAGVTGERNTTKQLFDLAWRVGLRNIPRDKNDDGYHTGTDNRKNMVDMGIQMFRDTQGRAVQDDDTLLEMTTFQYQSSGRTQFEKPMALKGSHDDLVMAFCGGCYMRSYFPTLVIEIGKQSSKPNGFDPWAYNKKEEESSKYPIKWR